jgi:hypothetical protein
MGGSTLLRNVSNRLPLCTVFLLLDPENGDRALVRSVVKYSPVDTQYSRRRLVVFKTSVITN